MVSECPCLGFRGRPEPVEGRGDARASSPEPPSTPRADDARWLVIADRLTEENNPLGEYIVLTLKYQGRSTPRLKARRLRQLSRDWQARYAPGAKLVSWYRWGLTLNFTRTEEILAHADVLRRIGLPLVLEVGSDKYNKPDACFFDADFTRLAAMHHSMTVENQNFSPGMDEEYHHFRDVKVWRVADRAVLYDRGFEASWSRLEFRADGLYGVEGDRAEHLLNLQDDVAISRAPATQG
jgi:hypothetical protein